MGDDGPLKLSNHVVPNRKEKKERKKPNLNFLCSTCPSAAFALQYGDFVPRDSSAANGPFYTSGPFEMYSHEGLF